MCVSLPMGAQFQISLVIMQIEYVRDSSFIHFRNFVASEWAHLPAVLTSSLQSKNNLKYLSG